MEENMEEDVEIALDIVVNEIANVTNKYAVCKDSKKNSIYKAKLEVLEKMQHEIYMNNGRIIKKILDERKKGTI
jgi:hypothetical protein